jgi:hypothetical protein
MNNLAILPHRIEITVPTTLARSKEVIEHLTRQFSAVFGGATVTKAEGSWTDPKGNIEVEHVALVYAWSNEVTFNDAILERLPHKLAEYVLDALGQEAVLYSIDGLGYLLERNEE